MKRNSVTKNALWLIMCRIVQAVLGLVINIITVRYLGPSNYGIISYAASVVAFFAPIMKLGFNHILVQEIVDQPEREGETLGTAIGLNFISAIACIIGVFCFTYITSPGEQTTLIVCILYSLNLLFQALEMIQYWYQAKLAAHYISTVSIIAYIIVTIYKIYLLVSSKAVYWFALSNAFDYLIISFGLIFVYIKQGTDRFSFSLCRGKEMFQKSKYFIVSSLMIAVFAQTDKIMLKMMLDVEEVGLYAAAVACAGMTNFVFLALIDSIRPVIFESKKKSNDLYEQRIINTYSLLTGLSIIQCIGFTILASPIINILYGAEYSYSSHILKIVVWQTIFSYVGAIKDIWLLAEGKQKYLWTINLAGAITNVLLNFLLIPNFGSIGAAIATVITQIVTNVIVCYLLLPTRKSIQLLIKSLRPKLFYRSIKMLFKD